MQDSSSVAKTIAGQVRPEHGLNSSAQIQLGDSPSETLWRSLLYFSVYRLIVAAVLLASIVITGGSSTVGAQDPRLFLGASLAYFLMALASLAILQRWHVVFNLQLTLQVVGDILFLTLLLYSSGGGKSGISMLMLVALAGAGLVGQGKWVLFYAALATLSLLLEQGYRVLALQGEIGDFFRTGLTSIGFFGSAIAARLLARRVVANEELAKKRGIQLADQMRINERVIRDMQDGVLVIDATGQVQQANPQATSMLGFPPTLPQLLNVCAPALAEAFFARRDLGIETETVIRLPESGRALRARFLPPGEGGNALIFLEDVGRLRQQAQQEKLAALGRLTANMAHEIRNPLAAISHAAELLHEEPPGKGMERLVHIIGENTQRLNRLVTEVMELGRHDQANPENIEPKIIIQQLVDELSLKDATTAHRVAIELPTAQSICFDRGHFHRVVANLLANALHFASNKPAAVRIFGENGRFPGRYALHLVDDGPGISGEDRNHIFEPFFTRRSSGTGLGLYIARELCEANGARLFLLDNAPGAHFCISCIAICQKPIPDQMQS